MSEKSHVGMLHNMCPVCLEETNCDILLDRRLRNSLEKDNYQIGDLCKDCKKLEDAGYVALIEAIAPLNTSVINPKDANRTGLIIHMKREKFNEVFNMSVNGPMAFIDQEVAAKLKKSIK